MKTSQLIRIPQVLAVLSTAGLFAPSLFAQNTTLATTTANSFGASVISYQYEEPGVMTLKAPKIGLDYSGTYVFAPQWPNVGGRWFLRGELGYASGQADYSSPISGTLDNTKNRYYEARAFMGQDLDMDSYVLAPYAGIGFRYLYNDLRGLTSGGSNGYRRENSYETAVVGLAHKVKMTQNARLTTSFEYMHLLKGKQIAKLSDLGTGCADITLDQKSGYGLRLSSMWRESNWSIGPTLTYWNIKASEIARSCTPSRDWLEPKNTTTELGLKAAYHF